MGCAMHSTCVKVMSEKLMGDVHAWRTMPSGFDVVLINLAACGVKVGYCDADLEVRNRSVEVLSHI